MGAGTAAYAEALADMEPVTLLFGGHTTGPGTGTVDAYVEYSNLVTQMSGGKITFEHDYAGAKVSLDKMADGLGQGRVDLGMYIPAYQPDEWPVANAIGGMSIYGQPHPISGRMAAFAAQAEFGQTFAPLQAEGEALGVFSLYPLYTPSHDVKLQCRGPAPTSLAELQGKRVRVSSPSYVPLAETLGMTPVSLVIGELFQGLQRGVVDCAVNSIGAHLTGGYVDVVDSWVFGTQPAGDFGETPTGFGMSRDRWEQLPLAAQQLLWDTQPQMLEMMMRAAYGDIVESMQVSRDGGMELAEFDPETTRAIEAYYSQAEEEGAAELEAQGLTDDGTAAVEQHKALYDKWWRIVTEELGYPADTSWLTVADFDVANLDLKPFVDRFYEEILLPRRPGQEGS
ncbi:hypothetical protein [Pseudonocardia kunmingensis]|uniref:hypothetical protein n=1 Tax=Pseudonocardia kunmingensis TaxID=630975 RepID=UPI0014788EEA|nr:hypothetical protein [Pseudonocardia kunmingensis]